MLLSQLLLLDKIFHSDTIWVIWQLYTLSSNVAPFTPPLNCVGPFSQWPSFFPSFKKDINQNWSDLWYRSFGWANTVSGKYHWWGQEDFRSQILLYFPKNQLGDSKSKSVNIVNKLERAHSRIQGTLRMLPWWPSRSWTFLFMFMLMFRRLMLACS